MKRMLAALIVSGGLLLLPLAGCPTTPPPPTPTMIDLGDFLRQRLTDRADSEPTDIADDAVFTTDEETDDFGDVLNDPAFAVD